MSGWDSYRAVYGAELRAAAREFTDHGWPVVVRDEATLLVVTGSVVDILEVPVAVGRLICGRLRDDGQVVPVAATPTGSWYYAIAAGGQIPAELAAVEGVRLHTAGATVLMPPSTVPDGWVHWRVAPARCGYAVPDADLLFDAAVDAVRQRAVLAHADAAGVVGTPARSVTSPDAQRSAGRVAVGTRS